MITFREVLKKHNLELVERLNDEFFTVKHDDGKLYLFTVDKGELHQLGQSRSEIENYYNWYLKEDETRPERKALYKRALDVY